MRLKDTIDYIGLWETLNNPNFNRVEFDTFKKEYGRNSFVMTPSKWIKSTNAIGIKSKAGKYGGGTYAHRDIALEFASNKRYEEAIKKLNLCINYKDSSQLLKDYKVAIDERNYQTACYYFDSGKYIEALEIFRTIPFFRDTKEKVNVCNEQIRESKYQTALTYINQKAYRLAVPLLQECSGYKDANELLISVSKKAIIQDHMYERKEAFKENRSLGICFLVQFIFFIVFTLIPVFKNINAAQTTDEKIYVIYPLVVFGLCILSALVIAILGNSVKMMTKIYFVYGIMLVATAVLGIGLISSLKDLTEGSQFIDIGTKITGGLIWNFVVGIVTIVKARKKLSE